MNPRGRQVIAILLFAVYAFFFASANLFYHSHQTASSRIVHSHPWSSKAHNHTTGQLLVIKVIATSAYEQAGTIAVSIPEPTHGLLVDDDSRPDIITNPYRGTFSLRAPPCMM